MEPMDIDEVIVVPDTPDKSAKQDVVRLGGLKSPNYIPSSKIANSRQFNPPRGIIRSGRSGNHASSLPFRCEDSFSNRSLVVRNERIDKGISHANKNYDNLSFIQNKNPLVTSQSSSNSDRPVVDVTGRSNEHAEFFQSNLGSTLAGEYKKESVLEHARSSWGRENSPHKLHNGSKERTGSNVVIVDSSPDSVDRQDTINLRKPSSQKRLVRNGCISPMNIAKGKQPVENFNCGSKGTDKSDYFPAVNTASGDHIPKQNIGEYSSSSSKGKEVLMKNSDGSRELFETSTSASTNKKNNGYSANRDIVLNLSSSDGWKTTHSQNSRHNFLSPLSREVQPIPIEDDSPYIIGQTSGNKALRKDNEDDSSIGQLGMKDVISNTRPSGQIGGQPRTESSRTNGRSQKAHTLSKRQKQGSTLSAHVECSRSTADDSEIVEMSTYMKEKRPQLTENLATNGLGDIGSVINIDEATPEHQHISSNSNGCSFSNEDARATQVELDERMARELQEQLYNENFTVGTNEIDTHIALSLQQEEESRRTVSRGRRPVSNPRGFLSGQSTSHFSLDLGRGGTHAGAPTPSRVARMRNAFTGRPRTLSASRGRNSNSLSVRQRNLVFPPGMDVEARMNILEAMESFSTMGVGNSFLQMQRDFNEDDYEMLLALDDNNHQHAGATARQINNLPESTVQIESLEEACSVCLETPTMGDVIRHLPCLHKFHKDCIDPWLKRRTTCPVCKSSAT